MKCIKCGEDIPQTSKSVKYCSLRCSKLYLKSQYRKRHAEQLKKKRKDARRLGYKSLYKSQKTNQLNKELILELGSCLICGTQDGLEVHHIRPRRYGGRHVIGNVTLLCHMCHYKFEMATKDLWK